MSELEDTTQTKTKDINSFDNQNDCEIANESSTESSDESENDEDDENDPFDIFSDDYCDNILFRFLESENKFNMIVKLHSCYIGKTQNLPDDLKNNLKFDSSLFFRLMTSYVSGDYDENHTGQFLIELYDMDQSQKLTNSMISISQNSTKPPLNITSMDDDMNEVNNFMSEWSEHVLSNYFENEKEKVFSLLTKLLKLIKKIQKSSKLNQNFCTVMTKYIWKQKCFRKMINLFPEETTGNDFAHKGMFLSLFTMSKWECDFENYVDSIEPLIDDEDTHITLLDYIYKIINTNIAYTYEDPIMISEKYCSPMNYNVFIFKILLKLIDKYSFDKIIENIKNDEKSYVVKPENILELPFFHKLYYIALYAIPICHTSIFNKYFNIKSSLSLYRLLYSKNKKELLKEDLLKCADLLSNTKNNNMNSAIQNLYINYIFIAKKIEDPEIFREIVFYIDEATSFTQAEKFYGNINKELMNFLSNTAGGHDGLIKNVHVRHHACTLIFKLTSIEGFNAFENLYENLFKYISEVNYFEWTTIDVSIEHQYKLIQTIYFLTDFYNHEINCSKETAAGTLYVLLKSGINLFELIHELCEYYQKKGSIVTDSHLIFQKMADSISMILQIHQNVYDKKIIKTIYPEVENKYSILVYELLKASTNINNELYTIVRRPDIAASITNVVYESISNHIDFCSNYLLSFRDLIIKNMETFSRLSNDKKNHIRDKLSIKIMEIEYPQEFLDPLLCTEITDPIKIPDIQEIFDRTSIMTHIHDSGQNPYTRQPLTVQILEDYNKNENVINEINKFLEKKREFEENYKKNYKNKI